MSVPSQINRWLEKEYPKPRIDPDWLNQCYEWIINEFHLNPSVDMDKIIEYVELQLLQSDLNASMVPGTGLPINVSELDNVKLSGPPILVEITSITEIGYSAITLQNIQQVRTDSHHLERLTNEDVDHDDENSMPDYPRSMLRFELSDGSTSFRAMEYQTLPELKLGTTPLGYKMLLKDVLIRRGIGFLEPNCVVMKGYQTSDHDELREDNFARSLRLRLGQEEPPEAQPAQPLDLGNPPPANIRSPLRELSEPMPSIQAVRNHDDDENQPRRRKVPSQIPSSSTSTLLTSSYFSTGPTGTRASTSLERLLSPSRTSAPNAELDDPSSSDYGDENFILDDAFLEEVNRAEQAAINAEMKTEKLPSQLSSFASGSGSRSGLNSAIRSVPVADVITIDDDDEDDKENVPLPTRRVRTRTLVEDEAEVITIDSDSD